MWSSNAEWSVSGYGNAIAEILPRLQEDKWKQAMVAFYGLDGNIIEHKGVKTFPKISDIWGLDAMIHHGKDWGADITISMQDIWVLDQNGLPLITRWIPMVFVDHEPMPDSTYHRLKQAYRIITVSKFGKKELEKKGITSTYIPMTINTDVFKPMDKKEMRKLFGIPEDIFMFGMIGANKENPPRKSFQEAMDAFKLFLDKHPNSGLYFHSYLQQPGGFPIEEYAKYIKINHRIYHRDQYKMMFKSDDEVMAKLMNCFDVLLSPSVSEGFGVPVIEAQSCFVAGTKFSTDTLKKWMQKPYSGELITIETNKGKVECTPEHPFYTDRGWIKAGKLTNEYRLLYNKNYEKNGALRGNIEEYSRIMVDPHDTRNSSNNWVYSEIGGMDYSQQKTSKTIFSKTSNEKPSVIQRAISLFSWFNRRGRSGINKNNEWWEMEANSFNNRWIRKTDEVSSGNDNDTFNIYREEEKRPLSISYSGNLISAVLPKYTAIFNNQERQDGISNQMERDTLEQNKTRKNNSRTRQDNNDDKTFEFAKIKNVRKRQVQDILVYNTTTGSNTYLANGFLVHNCGIPVIVNRFTSLPELVIEGETGEICEVAYKRFSPLIAYVGQPDHKSLYEKMEKLFVADRVKMGKKARDWVKQYDTKRVIRDSWIPFLERVQKEVYPK